MTKASHHSREEQRTARRSSGCGQASPGNRRRRRPARPHPRRRHRRPSSRSRSGTRAGITTAARPPPARTALHTRPARPNRARGPADVQGMDHRPPTRCRGDQVHPRARGNRQRDRGGAAAAAPESTRGGVAARWRNHLGSPGTFPPCTCEKRCAVSCGVHAQAARRQIASRRLHLHTARHLARVFIERGGERRPPFPVAVTRLARQQPSRRARSRVTPVAPARRAPATEPPAPRPCIRPAGGASRSAPQELRRGAAAGVTRRHLGKHKKAARKKQCGQAFIAGRARSRGLFCVMRWGVVGWRARTPGPGAGCRGRAKGRAGFAAPGRPSRMAGTRATAAPRKGVARRVASGTCHARRAALRPCTRPRALA